jgi:hypothetical protein
LSFVANNEALEPKVPSTWWSCSHHHDLVNHYGICVTISSFPHSWFITGFVSIVTRRVPLMEDNLFTHSCLWGSCCAIFRSLVSCVLFCRLMFVIFRLLTDFVCLYTYEFRLFLFKIVRSSVILLLPLLSVLLLLRSTAFDL